jgi:hypothetical protein
MMLRNISVGKLLAVALAVGAAVGGAPAQASVVTGGIVTPTITAGALPDSPSAHVDANTAASPFSGVVSINIVYKVGGVQQSYICSGALVGKRQVISAGHCVDTDGNGTVIDLTQPGSGVVVVFNNTGSSYTQINTASAVSMNPNYAGFGHCPAGVTAFCLNDDISVITLSQDAPASAKIYKVATNPVTSGTHITMAGYGTSGDGVNGYTVSPSFHTKRTGENYMDLFDGNDEAGWGGLNEVWYADFDGNGQDTFCVNYGACSPQLPNDRESGIGGGDSGGPSFVDAYGEMMLAANNTFSGRFTGQVEGTFGTYFGGIVLGGYMDYLQDATGGNITFVPEPGSIALLGMGALMLAGTRRRSKR